MCVHDENYSESILEMAVQHFPVVTIDRRLKGVPISFVGTDNEAASRELARYLLDRGYRKTCFVKPHAAETSTLQERIQGFKKAYNEYGLFADESLWITDIRATLPAYHQDRGEQQLAEDEEKIIEFIQKHPEIDSYFAVEYSLARIVYTCLRKLGLQEKCPVVCFDGSDNIVQESMFTHVKQNEKEIGSLSVRILADEIRGDDEVKTVLVPYHIREMTRGGRQTESDRMLKIGKSVFTNRFKKHTLKEISDRKLKPVGLEWNIQRRMRQNGYKQQNADCR